MLSDAEISRELLRIRYSPSRERYARRAPSVNGIAVQVGITREYLFRLIRTRYIPPNLREKLSDALTSERIVGARGDVRGAS